MVYHDILTTQVNIRQLQDTLDTYFITPTSGNIWFAQLGYYFNQNATLTFVTAW